VSLAARISFNNGVSIADCMIENDHGALLVLPSAMFLTPKIQLTWPVVWKFGRKIGVAWIV
jgi:hypothetical protein